MTLLLSEEKTASARTELARFFALADKDRAAMLEMFSPAVDSVWHDLVEQPEALSRFCGDAGVPVPEHLPVKGEGHIGWVTAYEAEHGKLPEVWFMDEAGSVRTDVRDAYLETGIVVSAWDCGPLFE